MSYCVFQHLRISECVRDKKENEAGDMNEITEEAAEDTEEKGVKIRTENLISENFRCNLNWRFIVNTESKSPIP